MSGVTPTNANILKSIVSELSAQVQNHLPEITEKTRKE